MLVSGSNSHVREVVSIGHFFMLLFNFAVNMNPKKPIPYLMLINNNDDSEFPNMWETMQ